MEMKTVAFLVICVLVHSSSAFSSLNIVRNSNKKLPETHPCDSHCTASGHVCELSRGGKPLCLRLSDSLVKCVKGKCNPSRLCKRSEGTVSCVCRNCNDDHHMPVCGSDGITYQSHCHLHREACLSKKHVTPRKLGHCLFGVKILIPPKDTTVDEGSTVRLHCIASGFPFAPTVNWYKKGRPLTSTTGRVSIISGSLVVAGATPFDSGTYTCRASSFVGVANAAAFVRVVPAPSCRRPMIIFPPVDATFAVNPFAAVDSKSKLRDMIDISRLEELVKSYASRMSLQRSVTVVNAVNVLEVTDVVDVKAALDPATWLIYRRAADKINAWIAGKLSVPSSVTLFRLYDIESLMKSSDGVRASASIDAAAVLKFQSKLPILKGDLLSLETAAFGRKMIFLYCLTSDAESVTWYRDGQRVIVPSRRTRIMAGGGLWIPGFRAGDAGVYTCVAENKCGKTRASAMVSFVESGVYSGSVLESVKFANTALKEVTFANATIDNLEVRNVVAENLKFHNVTIFNLKISNSVFRNLVFTDVTILNGEYTKVEVTNLKQTNTSHSHSLFSHSIFRNATVLQSKYKDVVYFNYTTVNSTFIGNSWCNTTILSATAVNQTQLSSLIIHQVAANVLEINVTVANSTQNHCFVKNYSGVNVSMKHFAMFNVTVLAANLTDCNATDGLYLKSRFVNVSSTNCIEMEVRRVNTSIVDSNFVDYKGVGVKNEKSNFNYVSYLKSKFVDVKYGGSLFCHVAFVSVNADGLDVKRSSLSSVSFQDSVLRQKSPFRNVRYYNVMAAGSQLIPASSGTTFFDQFVEDPQLRKCGELTRNPHAGSAVPVQQAAALRKTRKEIVGLPAFFQY
eukprot:m.53639 g.53639  ORF g.53639 m.53639 type:complete len:849 (+) comp34272_c0_seq3:2407-4953(+)